MSLIVSFIILFRNGTFRSLYLSAFRDVLGFSGCGIDDANDDTYGDIIVGVPGYDDGTTNDAGAVLLFYGSSSGPSTTPDVTIKGTEDDQLLGYDVAHLGDADVDGLGDFVIGAPNTDNGTWVSAGSTQIHYGDPAGVSSDPGVIIYGDASPADYGSSVAPGGDINGEGFDDFGSIVCQAPEHVVENKRLESKAAATPSG